jgi:hypothetical protein
MTLALVVCAPVATERNRHFAPSSSSRTESPPLTRGGPHRASEERSPSRGAPPLGATELHFAGEGIMLPTVSPRAQSSPSAMGALALHRSSQSASSGGAEILRHATLEGVLHLAVSSSVSSNRPNVGGVAASTRQALALGAFTIAAHLLCAHKESLVLHVVTWSSFDLPSASGAIRAVSAGYGRWTQRHRWRGWLLAAAKVYTIQT